MTLLFVVWQAEPPLTIDQNIIRMIKSDAWRDKNIKIIDHTECDGDGVNGYKITPSRSS